MVVKLPCVSDLSATDRKDLEALRYFPERDRVIACWKQIVEPAVRFTVPEPKFNLLARTVIAQIHISSFYGRRFPKFCAVRREAEKGIDPTDS